MEQKFAHLALRIDDVDATSWRLYVSLPPSGTSHGQVKLRVGPSETRVVDLAATASKWWRQPVVACSEALGAIWTSKSVDARYAERVDASETSLNLGGTTAFSASGFDRFLRRSAKLFWGASYYIVLEATRNVKVPELLNPHELKQRDGFRCILITLPQRSRKELADWLERETKIVPGVRTAKITLLFPDVLKIDNGLPTLVPRAEEILLEVQRETINATIPPELWLETESGHSVRLLEDHLLTLLSVRIAPTDRHFYLRYADEGGALFAIAERDIDNNCLQASVTVKAAEGVLTVPACSEAARSLMHRVRSRQARVIGIQTPAPFSLRVQTRETIEGGATELSDYADLPMAHVQRLLRSPGKAVLLDFGPFGMLRFKEQIGAAPMPRVLSEENRQFAQWLIFQYPESASMGAGGDAALVAALESTQLRTSHLAHFRAIRSAWENAS